MSKPDRSVIASVGQTVLCLVVAPVALLGVLYFASQAAEIRFGHLVLGLMVVVFVKWYCGPMASGRFRAAWTTRS